VQAEVPNAGSALGTLTFAYERVRFGAAALGPQEVAALEHSLSVLRTR